MHAALSHLIDLLDRPVLSGTSVIRWGCPVASFGDLTKSTIATLGLNPSNREFVDDRGRELRGESRRFPTLSSLGLQSWREADARHLQQILDSYREYFGSNPYDRWFKVLGRVISGAAASYYTGPRWACHLDIIPYATRRKWTELTTLQQEALVSVTGDTLGVLLRDSPLRVLILNGSSVLDRFQQIAAVRLAKETMETWSLRRQSGPHVTGFAYKGMVDTVSGVALERNLLVLGFNHNLQSSYGVSTTLIDAIRTWIGRATSEVLL